MFLPLPRIKILLGAESAPTLVYMVINAYTSQIHYAHDINFLLLWQCWGEGCGGKMSPAEAKTIRLCREHVLVLSNFFPLSLFSLSFLHLVHPCPSRVFPLLSPQVDLCTLIPWPVSPLSSTICLDANQIVKNCPSQRLKQKQRCTIRVSWSRFVGAFQNFWCEGNQTGAFRAIEI